MDKGKRFFFLIYWMWSNFLLVIIFLNVSIPEAMAFNEAQYYQSFLVNQLMVEKIREFRGEQTNKQYLNYLFNEARVKGINLPSWTEASLQKKLPEHHKLRLSEKERSIKYESIISAASKQYRLPPALIKAVIKVESNFDPEALSPKGAQGLMQLMPGTANSIGVTDAFDARENIFGGTKFLKRYLEKYGSLKKTLIAYNAGPGWVHKKEIPAETRNYIRDVVVYYKKQSDLKQH